VFNRALLGKWLWRYVHEREAWWKNVLDAKYGFEWDEWRSVDTFGPGGALEVYYQGWQLFSSHNKFDPGDGFKIRFWDDVWRGGSTLKEA
jgi:hypothetical protein